MSLVEAAREESARHEGSVAAVHVRVGPLSGVVPDALLFSYDVACEGTPLAGSRLIIEEVPLVVFCPRCETERTLDEVRLLCPECDTPTPDIRRGRELLLVALEMES